MTEVIGVCCKQMRADKSRWPSYRKCGRKATAIVAGKPYCGVHNPETREAERQKRNAVFHRQFQAGMAKDQITSVAIQAARGEVSWDAVKSAVEAWEALK